MSKWFSEFLASLTFLLLSLSKCRSLRKIYKVGLTSFLAPLSKPKTIHILTHFQWNLLLLCLLHQCQLSTTGELKEGEGELHQLESELHQLLLRTSIASSKNKKEISSWLFLCLVSCSLFEPNHIVFVLGCSSCSSWVVRIFLF